MRDEGFVCINVITMRILLFALFFFSRSILFAQSPYTKRDFQWLAGYKDSVEKTVINLLDFNAPGSVPVVTPFQIKDGALPSRSIAIICDTSGHVLLYSNGCNVLNRRLKSKIRKRHSIEFVDTCAICAKPEVSVSIFKQCKHC